jgi:NAD(P)-dependent dehydrogenase (short-subunit alcohol dehydrogenase family)
VELSLADWNNVVAVNMTGVFLGSRAAARYMLPKSHVIFRGFAVPGAIGIPQTEDLVAIWRTEAGQRFQNYRAVFTILDVAGIARTWLNELRLGDRLGENAPKQWVKWVNGGAYTPLQAISRYC